MTKLKEGDHNELLEEVTARIKTLGDRRKQLVEKISLRKKKLDESYYLHRFLANYRDLTLWITAKEEFVNNLATISDPELNMARLQVLGKFEAKLDSQQFTDSPLWMCVTSHRASIIPIIISHFLVPDNIINI